MTRIARLNAALVSHDHVTAELLERRPELSGRIHCTRPSPRTDPRCRAVVVALLLMVSPSCGGGSSGGTGGGNGTSVKLSGNWVGQAQVPVVDDLTEEIDIDLTLSEAENGTISGVGETEFIGIVDARTVAGTHTSSQVSLVLTTVDDGSAGPFEVIEIVGRTPSANIITGTAKLFGDGASFLIALDLERIE